MPTVEIPDGEDLTQLRSAAAFLDRGFKNPKTRAKLLSIAKELNPEAAIPELDAVAPIDEKIAGLEKTLSEKVGAIEEKVTSRERAEAVDSYMAKGHALLTKNGYSEQGIADVEKLMSDEGLTSYEAGAALYEKRNPPPAPTAPDYAGPPAWNMATPDEGDKGHEMLLKRNYKGFTQQAIGSVMKELRGQR